MSFLFDRCTIYDLSSPEEMSGFTCGDQEYWFIDPYNKTGCRFIIIVDAYNNEQTVSFYERNGFRPVFSSDIQEKEYRHINSEVRLNTRLMYYDLLAAIR